MPSYFQEKIAHPDARARHAEERIAHVQEMRNGTPQSETLMSRFKAAVLFKAKHYTTKAAPRMLFAAATTAVIAVGTNELTKDENGNGYFQPQIDAVTSLFTPTR